MENYALVAQQRNTSQAVLYVQYTFRVSIIPNCWIIWRINY